MTIFAEVQYCILLTQWVQISLKMCRRNMWMVSIAELTTLEVSINMQYSHSILPFSPNKQKKIPSTFFHLTNFQTRSHLHVYQVFTSIWNSRVRTCFRHQKFCQQFLREHQRLRIQHTIRGIHQLIQSLQQSHRLGIPQLLRWWRMDAKYRAKGYESYRFSHGKNRFYDLILRQI